MRLKFQEVISRVVSACCDLEPWLLELNFHSHGKLVPESIEVRRVSRHAEHRPLKLGPDPNQTSFKIRGGETHLRSSSGWRRSTAAPASGLEEASVFKYAAAIS